MIFWKHLYEETGKREIMQAATKTGTKSLNF